MAAEKGRTVFIGVKQINHRSRMSKFSNMNFHVLTAWINMAPAVQKLAWNLFNECCRRYDLGIILTPVSIIRDFTLSGKTKLYG